MISFHLLTAHSDAALESLDGRCREHTDRGHQLAVIVVGNLSQCLKAGAWCLQMDAEIDAASGKSLEPTVGKQFGLAVENVRPGRERKYVKSRSNSVSELFGGLILINQCPPDLPRRILE